MNAIIFLDVDGVLNCRSTKVRVDRTYRGIDDQKVVLLKKIVDAYDAKIVLTSTWREFYNPGGSSDSFGRHLESKLKKQGLKVYECTEILGWSRRALEISEWLSRHHEVTHIIILDDEHFDFEKYELDKYQILTDDRYGLTEDDVNEIISNPDRFLYIRQTND